MELLSLFLIFLFSYSTAGEPTSDRAVLLSFISRVPHSPRKQWNSTSSACDWVGVTCDANRSAVVALRLPASGLVGTLPPDTLGHLSSLRILSLHANRLSGALPEDLSNLIHLERLYLQNNLFSGGFPQVILHITGLSQLDLSQNNFSGEIPSAVNNLTQLTVLFLQQNYFSGSIPLINIPGLSYLNVSHNALNGSIPAPIQRFPASSFAGNLGLCGAPLKMCTPSIASPPSTQIRPLDRTNNSTKFSTTKIVAIVVAAGVVGLLALMLLVIWWYKKQRSKVGPKHLKSVAVDPEGKSDEIGTTPSSKEDSGARKISRNRLVFVGGGGGYKFQLEDLLRASAEVMGKGTVGNTYKAVLEDGTTVVVKRLREVAVSKREFEEIVEKLGMVHHGNLLPVRAYYYSKNEKLLISDYIAGRSFSSSLHDPQREGSARGSLDWSRTLRVAMAVARGVSHLHGSAGIVHGNIKSSNVLLRHNPDDSAISNYGLSVLFKPGSSQASQAGSGYRAPELSETLRPTLKSDVYSFGVLLLELLTGKQPNRGSAEEAEGTDLPRWVQSVAREEWTSEVVDAKVVQENGEHETEMVQLLHLAMACVATEPGERPDMVDVVGMMDELARKRGGKLEGGDGIRDSFEPAVAGHVG
ncbi:hypothetical protein HPP92_024280 [Vanilla planifolia]|uniref:Protein kinase domain-containing protein n=1 Tax=Vanilla planifolia TaxID=51239 RepID=A0A835PUU2_VANPL|nr:hypothetical protein HPP92_024280 [Vanilla planifolia]